MAQFTTAKKKVSDFKKLEQFASAIQFEADNITRNYIELKRLVIFSDLFDFNILTIQYLIPLFISKNAIEFLFKNHHQLERKLSILNLIEFGKIYNITTLILKNEPKDLKALKEAYKAISPAK